MKKHNSIIGIFSGELKEVLDRLHEKDKAELTEIRLRTERPALVYQGKREYYLSRSEGLCEQGGGAYIVRANDIKNTLSAISEHSLYAYEEEVRRGFITIAGGHRIGLCGRAVAEGESIKTIRNITGLNIRIARGILGCAKNVINHLIAESRVCHTMIVSPPGCGKTTLLRDIVRLISDGIPEQNFKGASVAVIDERSEIAASYMGIPQNDVGIRTDVLDCAPKAEGMRLMLRSMSPAVIAVDEIGSNADADAVEELVNAGVKIICTAHGSGIDDIKKNPALRRIVDGGRLERIIILSGRLGMGTIERIYDGSLNEILRGEAV